MVETISRSRKIKDTFSKLPMAVRLHRERIDGKNRIIAIEIWDASRNIKIKVLKKVGPVEVSIGTIATNDIQTRIIEPGKPVTIGRDDLVDIMDVRQLPVPSEPSLQP